MLKFTSTKSYDSPSLDIHSLDYKKEPSGFLKFLGIRKLHKTHPYRMHLNGNILEEDHENRKKFAQVRSDYNLCTLSSNSITYPPMTLTKSGLAEKPLSLQMAESSAIISLIYPKIPTLPIPVLDLVFPSGLP